MTIRVVYSSLPPFLATDQDPAALRTQVGGLWVDYVGSVPTQADIDALFLPSSATLAAQDQAAINAVLTSPGSVVRGLALVLLDLANGVIPYKPAVNYTPAQLLTLIQQKMR